MLVAAVLAVSALAATQSGKLPDVVRAGPASPPAMRASEDTVINYTGGEPASFTGSLDADDSTYNRATTCAALSGVGTAAAYDTITINNTGSGTANFIVAASLTDGSACGDANDTFFTLYSAFNPAAPLTGCLAVSDDIDGAANRCSSSTFSIPAGETRVLVVTGYNNASDGGLFDYRINFTGTVPVELMSFDID